MPRMQVPTGTQRRNQKNDEENESPDASPSKEFEGSNRKIGAELKITTNDEEFVNSTQVKEADEESKDESNSGLKEVLSSTEPSLDAKISQFSENGEIDTVYEDVMESTESERITEKVVEEKATASGYSGVEEDGTVIEQNEIHIIKDNKVQTIEKEEYKEATTISDSGRKATDKIDSGTKEMRTVKNNDEKRVERIKIINDISENHVPKPESMGEGLILLKEEKKDEDFSLKLKLKEDANMRKEVLARLAEENFRKGNKLFYYPDVVKPDQDIEVFLNRSFSTLKNEPDVLIMGAFNDWKWKSFTIKLSKSHLNGDWWSCHVHVPKEAYKMDFVFFNGQDVYENNENKDFCINVEGGMDVFDFENFLLEDKRREQKELARQKAEMERRQEEQRRIEAEKANQEADRVQAKEEVAKRRRMLEELVKKAKKSVDNVWYIEPREFKGEDEVKLYYNRISGPLAHAKDVWIHGGHNNWKDGLSIISKLIRSERKDGDWWFASVVVPDGALVLDWVFADGPPQQAIIYDNNHLQDFHAIVPKSIPTELYWVEEEQKIYRKLQVERRLREEAARAKAEKTARMKRETKERTLRTFLLSQKHIVYTDPLDVQAGKTVIVFYNPANTVLNGKPEIWLRCSFNRWTHRMGLLPPQKMLPAENGSHLKATVKVPLDAYMMDFVFSEKEDGGIFDNKNGMDYHVPVFGGVVKEPPMHIVHISVEMAPIAKVGGLGDVVTSLSRAVQDMNHHVDIILPKYDCLKLNNDIIHCHDWSSAPVAWLYKEHYRHYGLNKARVVFTIHNLEFGASLIGKAMQYSDKATTVSPTYSQEVSGNPVIASHLYKFHGILNGIDQDIWDPYNDKFIPLSYTSENVVEGKRAAKEALQQRLGLKKADLPLVGIITRLTHQKGIHLIKHSIWHTLERSGQVVLLGSAPDPRIQNDFVNLANQLHSSHNDRARLCLTYDEPLSHLIYAGADFILVPSIFEPCGLTQLIAMRYGSIAVVRKTGGLYDTVFDVDHDKERAQACGLEPNGFNFDGADAAGVDYALNRAITAWYEGREWFNSLCKRVMEQDWSWNRPALDYLELYRAARKC
ncbi:Soluble starch synthase 3, chloroplastic amyloplastic [Olea europaea subsp. europaea]|uniref:starch synthase n=1 Tax=Olea europaea subsp. europaea TaxID=158383 RepID=A0A8S0UEX8_OLEEU|nr:Soluble starch synthase 3, chloroplastic amyloplastic [Olea europaea subsp. europaea]